MSQTVSAQYEARVLSREIEHDPAQESVARKLTRLGERLAEHRLERK